MTISLAQEIHEAWTFQYDTCEHGSYTGGAMHGSPYAMCDILAERIERRRERDDNFWEAQAVAQLRKAGYTVSKHSDSEARGVLESLTKWTQTTDTSSSNMEIAKELIAILETESKTNSPKKVSIQRIESSDGFSRDTEYKVTVTDSSEKKVFWGENLDEVVRRSFLETLGFEISIEELPVKYEAY